MQNTLLKSGFITILGRPSTGKSTLLNHLCRQRISIVSPVPQTTRNTIRGILNDSRGQIVFLDTPGLHDNEGKVNLRMRSVALETIGEAEAILYTVDTTRAPGDEERIVAQRVRESGLPGVVVYTKCDQSGGPGVTHREFIHHQELDHLPVFNVRGLHRPPSDEVDPAETGVPALISHLFDILPPGEPWYPEDYYTDQDPRFRIAEIIREQAINRTHQEVPHAIYVEVADLEERDAYYTARAFLFVERSSQQGILVGKGGGNITAIREESQRILNKLFPKPVRLQLQVKVRPRWRRDDGLLKRLIH